MSAPELAKELLELQANMAAVLDAVSGHRAAMEERGFSPTAAEQAAVTFHAMLMNAAMRSVR